MASPNTLQQQQRASELFMQLDMWRVKGYEPRLCATPDGWILVLDMTHWGQRDIGERAREMLLRFNSNCCETPEAAIEDALKVVQP